MSIKHSFSTLILLFHRNIERIPLTMFVHAASLASMSIRPIFSASSCVEVVTNTMIAELSASTSPPQPKQIACLLTHSSYAVCWQINGLWVISESFRARIHISPRQDLHTSSKNGLCLGHDLPTVRPIIPSPPARTNSFGSRGDRLERNKDNQHIPGLTPPFPAP